MALIVGAASIVGTGALTACSSEKDTEKPAESSQPSSAPAVAPTDKANLGSFTPTITARPVPSR